MKKKDFDRVQSLLLEAVVVLCQNSVPYNSKLCVKGLLGITLDDSEVFLVDIKETITKNEEEHIELSESSSDEQTRSGGSRKRRKRRSKNDTSSADRPDSDEPLPKRTLSPESPNREEHKLDLRHLIKQEVHIQEDPDPGCSSWSGGMEADMEESLAVPVGHPGPGGSQQVVRAIGVRKTRPMPVAVEIVRLSSTPVQHFEIVDSSTNEVEHCEYVKTNPVQQVEIVNTSTNQVHYREYVKTSSSPVQHYEVVNASSDPVHYREYVKTSPVQQVEIVNTSTNQVEYREYVKSSSIPVQQVEIVKSSSIPVQQVETVKTSPNEVEHHECEYVTASSSPVKVELVKTISTPVQHAAITKGSSTPIQHGGIIKRSSTPVTQVESIKRISTPHEHVETPKRSLTPVQHAEVKERSPSPVQHSEIVTTSSSPVQNVESLQSSSAPIHDVDMLNFGLDLLSTAVQTVERGYFVPKESEDECVSKVETVRHMDTSKVQVETVESSTPERPREYSYTVITESNGNQTIRSASPFDTTEELTSIIIEPLSAEEKETLETSIVQYREEEMRPPFTLRTLVGYALYSLPKRRATPNQVIDFIRQKIAYYGNDEKWCRTVNTYLSNNRHFTRLPRASVAAEKEYTINADFLVEVLHELRGYIQNMDKLNAGEISP